MRAIQVQRLDGPDAVELVEMDEPEGEGVVIDVMAAGVAFPDLLLTRGEYQMKPPLPFVPGVECSGVVRSAPEGAGLAPGDRVCTFTFGTWQETVVADPSTVLPVPAGMSHEAAAGLVMNYHTAHFSLHRRGRLAEGEVVLVHGAAGGVGTAAVQLAHGAGARVLAAVSDDAKAEVARRAGADAVVRTDGDWKAAVKELTDGRGADVILDVVGGDRFDESLRCLAPEGRLLVVGFASGRIPEVRVNRLLLRNVDVVGVAWGAFLGVEPGITTSIQRDIERLAGEGVVDPIVGSVHPLEDAAAALADLDERRATGKVVLRMREEG